MGDRLVSVRLFISTDSWLSTRSHRYPDAYSVIVHVDRSLQPQAEAGTCHSCRDELCVCSFSLERGFLRFTHSRLDYEEAKISIRWLEKSDFDSRGNLRPRASALPLDLVAS